MVILQSEQVLSPLDVEIINQLQGGFPLQSQPFFVATRTLCCDESTLLQHLQDLLQRRVLTRFGPLFQIEKMGGCFTLAAMAVPSERFDDVMHCVNNQPEVAHNYERTHWLNMWFVLAAINQAGIDGVCQTIEARTGLKVYTFPKQCEFFVGMRLTVGGQGAVCRLPTSRLDDARPITLDDTDWQLIRTTQTGLPLVTEPYQQIASGLGITEADVITRLSAMQAAGIIRRIGIVPNHYAIGYRANGMAVFDIDDEHIAVLGEKIGQMDCVSHCYHRPRHPPLWPYNLFAMLHGHSRQQVFEQEARLLAELGPFCKGHQVLFSTRILKKTGVRV